MSHKLHIKKGDTVFVNSGVNKGSRGRVIRVLPSQNKAFVEGINMITKRKKQPDAQNPDGGLVRQEAPLHISKLNLIDTTLDAPVRVGRKRDESGKLVRYSKKSGEIIK